MCTHTFHYCVSMPVDLEYIFLSSDNDYVQNAIEDNAK